MQVWKSASQTKYPSPPRLQLCLRGLLQPDLCWHQCGEDPPQTEAETNICLKFKATANFLVQNQIYILAEHSLVAIKLPKKQSIIIPLHQRGSSKAMHCAPFGVSAVVQNEWIRTLESRTCKRSLHPTASKLSLNCLYCKVDDCTGIGIQWDHQKSWTWARCFNCATGRSRRLQKNMRVQY